MPSRNDSLEQTDKELQLSVKGESENEYVQQFKEMEKYAYERSEGNEEMFKSEIQILPLCFASFKVIKQIRYDVKFEESSRLENKEHLSLCFSSFAWLKTNHEQIEKFDQGIVVKDHFFSPELDEEI